MDNRGDHSSRDAFLWKVCAQFEGLARWVILPSIAQVWEDGRQAVFSVRHDDYELLRFSASFDDDGAQQRGCGHTIRVVVEWHGEATELLVLGWQNSLPDAERGLDTTADFAEGSYAGARGKVVDLLRNHLAAALGAATPSLSRLPAPSPRRGRILERIEDKPEPNLRRPAPPAPKERAEVLQHKGDLRLLSTSIGLMAEVKLARPEDVFAGFIEASRAMGLRQRQVASAVEGALLHLYLVEKAFFEGPSWKRPNGARVKGGALMEGVLGAKAAIFRRSRSAQKQKANELVDAMEVTYRGLLERSGALTAVEVDDKVKRAFGNAGGIVTKAVEGFRASVWPNWARLERAFARRISLE